MEKKLSIKEVMGNYKRNSFFDYEAFKKMQIKRLRKARKSKSNDPESSGDFKCTYESEAVYLEPYLEELDYEFNPEPEISPCTSKTEIPWDNLLIPKAVHLAPPTSDLAKAKHPNCKCNRASHEAFLEVCARPSGDDLYADSKLNI